MGRHKLHIRRIENNTNRQVTFSRRRDGLLKKLYELSVLCDIDIGLVMFSPSGRLSQFSGRRRIEDVLARYIDLPEHDRAGGLQNRQLLVRTLQKMKYDTDHMLGQIGNHQHSEELQRRVRALQNQCHIAEEQLKFLDRDPAMVVATGDYHSHRKFLIDALNRVTQRKMLLLDQHQNPNLHKSLEDLEPVIPTAYGGEMESVGWPPQVASETASICDNDSEAASETSSICDNCSEAASEAAPPQVASETASICDNFSEVASETAPIRDDYSEAASEAAPIHDTYLEASDFDDRGRTYLETFYFENYL